MSAAQSSSDNPGVKFPPPLFFILGFLAGYIVHRLYPVSLLPRHAGRLPGIVLVAAGVALIADFVMRFRQAGTTIRPDQASSALVTTGPFRYSRNPAYLAWVVIYLGATLLLNSWWPLLILPMAMLSLQQYAIRREEAFLEQKFGEEYRAYKQRVRRWL